MPQLYNNKFKKRTKLKRTEPVFDHQFYSAQNLQPGFADISKILTRFSSAVKTQNVG